MYFYKNKKAEAPIVADNETEQTTSDWKTYVNTKYGFEFKYPADWKAENVGVDFPDMVVLFPSSKEKEFRKYMPDSTESLMTIGSLVYILPKIDINYFLASRSYPSGFTTLKFGK